MSDRFDRRCEGQLRVRLLDLMPDLFDGVSRSDRTKLGTLTVPIRQLQPGPWWPTARWQDGLHSFLVLDGGIARELRILDQRAFQLFAAGDPFGTDERIEGHGISRESGWKVMMPTTIAVLDGEFTRAARAVPRLQTAVDARSRLNTAGVVAQLALVGISDLGERILATLWHLAERWGEPDNEWTVVRLPLTQEFLAELVRARRPSVNARLKPLRDAGVLTYRRPHWALRGAPPPSLDDLRRAVHGHQFLANGDRPSSSVLDASPLTTSDGSKSLA